MSQNTDMPGEAGTDPMPEQPTPVEPKRSSIPPWVWIVVAIVAVIALVGLYSTQTEHGRAWMLGLRSMVAVPKVVGQTQSQAQTTLEASGLRVGQVSQEPTLAVPPGTVVSQSPSAGSEVKKDSAVDISVADIPTVQVPNVVGQLQADAITALAEAGLRTGTVNYVYDSNVQAGKVGAQTPSANEKVSVGSAVNLTVSMGNQQGQVPNVIGLSQDDANSVITAAGFKVTTVKAASANVPPGDVVAQSPAAGVVTAAGSTVTITVSTGPAPASAPPATTETPAPPTNPTNPPPPTEPPAATTVKVPDVVGMSVKDAVGALKSAKLKVSFAYDSSETDVLKVIKQDPESGTEVDPGSTVVITIGLPKISLPDGKPTQPMPLPVEKPVQLPAKLPTSAPQPSLPTTP
jgi:beta-lactam-binding protein with PASTA domain